MPRTFRDFWNSLMLDIPALDQFKAQDFINYAWRDIREARRWSFLSAEGSLDFPDQITTGTVSLTQWSDVVIGSVAARAVWDVIGLNLPLTDRQLRIGGGPLYQIISYDPIGDSVANTWNTNGDAGAIQLSRTYKETTDATATYSIYKAYHSPPSTDFLTFTSVKDIQNGRTLRISLTREDLDLFKDPMRQAYGDPYFIGMHSADANGNIKIEAWPHLLTAKSLLVEYERAGTDFTATESLPAVIPESLLMERALVYACRWANDNQQRFDTLKKGNWPAASVLHDAAYKEMLQIAKIKDEELFQINITYAPDRIRHAGYGDTTFAQSHDTGYGF